MLSKRVLTGVVTTLQDYNGRVAFRLTEITSKQPRGSPSWLQNGAKLVLSLAKLGEVGNKLGQLEAKLGDIGDKVRQLLGLSSAKKSQH